MKFNWKKLYSVIDRRRRVYMGGISWRTLAKLLGVTPSVFTRISQEKPVSVENLAKLLGYADSIDYSLKPYLKG
jgi:hypothetical protein